MKSIITKILENTKDAYKESIIIDNNIIENKLLSIMLDLKYLENELDNIKIKKKRRKKFDQELHDNEIEKVKRKVPLWLRKKNQYNFKILKAFMDLSNNNSHYVNITTLETHSNIKDGKKFLSNYNLLKTISEKNHAKVFEEKNGKVILWTPIADIVTEYFT